MPRKRKRDYFRNSEPDDQAAELERQRQLSREMEELFKEHPLPEFTDADRIGHSRLSRQPHGHEEALGPLPIRSNSSSNLHLACRKESRVVGCFEKLAEFSKVDYLNRLHPVTKWTIALGDMKGSSICDGDYTLDGGAERASARMDGLDRIDLLPTLWAASHRSKATGSEDDEECDLFEDFMPTDFGDVEDLKEPHSLSRVLRTWRTATILASYDEVLLTDEGKETKDLSDKAIRAIRRLSPAALVNSDARLPNGLPPPPGFQSLKTPQEVR
ncbi:hypothetical protein DL767_011227 [Monosporascus sp. MG133]|nr:hypothetical protein DL767_011227 [Monosporascus sp. MG133]